MVHPSIFQFFIIFIMQKICFWMDEVFLNWSAVENKSLTSNYKQKK
jgi:hypothetical protein